MAQFTIRVVLHENATWSDYELLASELADRNVTDVITSSDGIKYKMPPAEYQCHGDLTAAQVRDICAEAARMTGKKHAVLVTKSSSRAWTGLEKA